MKGLLRDARAALEDFLSGPGGKITYELQKPSYPYRRAADIAKRLGVEPYVPTPDNSPTVMIATAQNVRYDLFELIEAFLDKVDAVSVALEADKDRK